MLLAALLGGVLLGGPATVWEITGPTVTPEAGADRLHPVGSLQKAFLVEAWAARHADGALPVAVACDGSGCWRRSGHGLVDLPAAVAVSCNEYFRVLARDLPEDARRQALLDAGFEVPDSLSPDAALGLGRIPFVPRITPRRLLLAYQRLLERPWPQRDDLRLAWLDGMRRAARTGTASRAASASRLAKTGTVPAEDGAPGALSGWAVLFDPEGSRGRLAYLPRGTGAEAARLLTRGERGTPAVDAVRVRLFETLSGARVSAMNSTSGPVTAHTRSGPSFVGAGAEIDLVTGTRLGEGAWLLRLEPQHLRRLVKGSLSLEAGGLVLTTTPRDWVEGVLRGELGPGAKERDVELAAAALRYLARGPRHGAEDVCDLSHCARFVGYGPATDWPTPQRAVLRGDVDETPRLGEAEWSAARRRATEDGPSLWTPHCGGEPLSERAVWGRGETTAMVCPRHSFSSGAASAWERALPMSVLEAAFHGPILELAATVRDGVRFTRVRTPARERFLTYDALHRLLAERLSWSSLPSPPDRFERIPGGYVVRGHGSGHRVGLCLGE